MANTTEKWSAELNRLTKEFTASFSTLTPEELNRKPNATTWSIAQIINHLIKVNETYFPIIEALHKGTYHKPWTARVPSLVRFFGNLILKGVEPKRQKKTRTFPIWEPLQSEINGKILDRFVRQQEELIEKINSCQAILYHNPVISSPANRFVVYQLDTAFDIIVSHEKRHLNQALEVKEMVLHA